MPGNIITVAEGVAENTMKLRTQKGYTIVETIVGGVILAAAIIGIYTVVSQGTKISREEMLRRRALQEMERVLEDPAISSKAYLTLKDTTFPSVVLSGNVSSTPKVKVKAVTYSSGSVTVPAQKVTVTMEWTVEGTRKDSAKLQTVVTLVSINN